MTKSQKKIVESKLEDAKERVLIEKTGDFETDVRAGYYRQERNINKTQAAGSWEEDFQAYLLSKGVPQQYVSKVSYYAYERGGEEEVLNEAYGLIQIFAAEYSKGKTKLRDELVSLLNQSQEEKELAGPLADSILSLFQQHQQKAIDAVEEIRAWGESNLGLRNPSTRSIINAAYKALEALNVPE